MIKLTRLFILTLILALLVACGGESENKSSANTLASIDTNSPDGALKALIASMQNNDVQSLMQASLSDEDYKKAIAEFEKSKAEPSESDKAQYLQMMSMLTSEDAEDQLMAMATPQLEQMRTQLPMMLMMGKGMASQTIQSSSDIPDAQKETATKLVNALMDFVGENDILSEEVTRKALSAAITTAKSLDMESLDELKNMSFDQAMSKASLVLGGFKNVLGAYGISVDDLLASVNISDVVENGDSATMNLAYDFLGQTFDQDVKMVKKDGKWLTEK